MFSHQPSPPDCTVRVICPFWRSERVGLTARNVEEMRTESSFRHGVMDVEHFGIGGCVCCTFLGLLHVGARSSRIGSERKPPRFPVCERSTEWSRPPQQSGVDQRGALLLVQLQKSGSLLQLQLPLRRPEMHLSLRLVPLCLRWTRSIQDWRHSFAKSAIACSDIQSSTTCKNGKRKIGTPRLRSKPKLPRVSSRNFTRAAFPRPTAVCVDNTGSATMQR